MPGALLKQTVQALRAPVRTVRVCVRLYVSAPVRLYVSAPVRPCACAYGVCASAGVGPSSVREAGGDLGLLRNCGFCGGLAK